MGRGVISGVISGVIGGVIGGGVSGQQCASFRRECHRFHVAPKVDGGPAAQITERDFRDRIGDDGHTFSVRRGQIRKDVVGDWLRAGQAGSIVGESGRDQLAEMGPPFPSRFRLAPFIGA